MLYRYIHIRTVQYPGKRKYRQKNIPQGKYTAIHFKNSKQLKQILLKLTQKICTKFLRNLTTIYVPLGWFPADNHDFVEISLYLRYFLPFFWPEHSEGQKNVLQIYFFKCRKDKKQVQDKELIKEEIRTKVIVAQGNQLKGT